MVSKRFAAALVGVVAILAGCTTCGGGQATTPPPPPPPDTRPEFDGARAFADLQAQCDFGPRNPGSNGHEACRAWLAQQMTALADQVVLQDFNSATPMGGPYDFQNIVGLFNSDGQEQPLLIAAHWDTRPVADEDPIPENRQTPILGANDGASGVAVLLELGRLMKAEKPSRPVMVALLDAEDSGKAGTTGFRYLGFCIGSDYLARHWPTELPTPGEMVLVDLVGADSVSNPRLQPNGATGAPRFRPESNSLRSNPSLVNRIWSAAEALGHAAFSRSAMGAITDDHLPFIDQGIPAVDIIHVFPAEWHTVDDTPQHCSADTLHEVGDTLVDILWE